ncbi:MAG TPA: aldo/keto reductase [Sedimentisphaerales bacterium]|nr:aldo/keto reductase [Sedimentisphaerales bacterium]
MRYAAIHGTDLQASTICLGTATFGSEIASDEAFRIMDAFADAGGNFIDTARVYADWLPNGQGASETTIGNWLRLRGNRQKIILATKGGHPDLKTMHISRMSREEVGYDIEQSLRRLHTDHIDLYWLHRDDTAIPAADILDMMEGFVSQGTIRYYGCSNWRVARIKEALSAAKTMGVTGFAGDQPMWSLAQWKSDAIGDTTLVQMSPELYELHKASGLAAIPYSSQAKGFFTKFARDGENIAPAMKRRFWNDSNLARARKVIALAKELDVPVAAIPLAWLAGQPFPTIPIIGPRNVTQLKESLTAADIVLKPQVVEQLRSI